MTLRDMKEVTVCAAMTTVVIVGAFSARAVLSVAPLANERSVKVDGLTLTAVAKRSEKPYTVEVTVKAANPLGMAKDIDVNLALVRSDFTGNPMSRSIQVNDYKLTTERSPELKLNVPAGQTREKTILLPIDSRSPEGPAVRPLGTSPTYSLNVVQGSAALTEDGLSEPVPLSSVRHARDPNTLAMFPAEMAWRVR